MRAVAADWQRPQDQGVAEANPTPATNLKADQPVGFFISRGGCRTLVHRTWQQNAYYAMLLFSEKPREYASYINYYIRADSQRVHLSSATPDTVSPAAQPI